MEKIYVLEVTETEREKILALFTQLQYKKEEAPIYEGFIESMRRATIKEDYAVQRTSKRTSKHNRK